MTDVQTSYQEYQFNQSSIMSIRLETEKQLERIKGYLSGKKLVIEQVQQGEMILNREKWVKVSEPKLNEEGINSVMQWMSTTIDPSTVQGNLEKWDDLKQFMMFFRQDFNDILTKNRFKWKIANKDYDQIIDPVYNMVRLFLSRTVGNLERDSYIHTLRTMENQRIETQDKNNGGGWSLNPFKR